MRDMFLLNLHQYKGTQSTGHVITSIGLRCQYYRKHIIIVEDIIDTGKTMHEFLPQIVNQQPASLKIAVLLLRGRSYGT